MESPKSAETNSGSVMSHRYSRPLVVVMLAAMAASIISGATLNFYGKNMTALGLAQDSTLMNLKLFEEYCSIAWLSLMIWLGIYHALSGKKRVLSVFGLVLGLVSTEGYGWHLLDTRDNLTAVVQTYGSWALTHSKELESQINNDKAPLESRSSLSKTYARLTYQETGKTISFLDKDGVTKPYTPIQDDIKLRNQMLDISKTMNIITPQLLFLGVLYMAVGFLALGFGAACFMIDKRRLVRLMAPEIK